MILASPVRLGAPLQPLSFSNQCIARYLNDLWVFDTQEYSWRQIEFKETELKPSYVANSYPDSTLI